MNSNRNEPDVTHGQEEIRNPEVSYDSTDLSARAVVMFLIFLALAGILMQVMLWGVYKYLAKENLQAQPASNPIGTSRKELRAIGGDPALKFPPPRLQPDPVADFNKFRAREEELLNSYGWVDRASGKVHIPIEQAIGVVAQTGLPTRPNAAVGQKTQAPPGAAGAAGGLNVQAGRGKQTAP